MNDDTDTRDHVVLLHGLGRSALSMVVPAWRMRAAGFGSASIDYPSRHAPIEQLARHVAERLPSTSGQLHFFTHSLGGLVARCVIRDFRPANLGRVVMLSPPNRGSLLASQLRRNPIFRHVTGPAGQQLGSDPDDIERLLGPIDYELGVITGDRPMHPLAKILSRPHDGIVSVDETRVDGMTDFLVVHRGHTLIMNDRQVAAQAVHFFRHGRFRR